jgi:branched-chain amino acid transport system permease protein
MICVLGGLGNMIGGFVAAFIISQFIAVGRAASHRMGLRGRVPVLHRCDLLQAAWPVREQVMSGLRPSTAAIAGLMAVAALPLVVRVFFGASEKYYLHLLIQILLWAFIYTGWSLMGRFGLTSLGHGAFTGIGAYVTVMLWNIAGISPWLGIPVAVLMATIVGMLIGYPCFRLRITGHYFGLLTLALTEFVRLCIVGLRDYTGGSLGTQPKRYGDGLSLYAMQFEPDRVLSYYIVFALWLFGLFVWRRVDRSMDATRSMRQARTRMWRRPSASTSPRKSSRLRRCRRPCALGGAAFGQYQMYIGPDDRRPRHVPQHGVRGCSGGMWVMLGPTVGPFSRRCFRWVASHSKLCGVEKPAWLGGAGT